jgi:hypothetical protein
MATPGHNAAVRAALPVAARDLGAPVAHLTVSGVVRRRKAHTKVPFYIVSFEDRVGNRRAYFVTEDATRVEPYGYVPTH